MERSLMTTGTSLYVNIPESIVDLFGLKVKDRVKLKVLENGVNITFGKSLLKEQGSG